MKDLIKDRKNILDCKSLLNSAFANVTQRLGGKEVTIPKLPSSITLNKDNDNES